MLTSKEVCKGSKIDDQQPGGEIEKEAANPAKSTSSRMLVADDCKHGKERIAMAPNGFGDST